VPAKPTPTPAERALTAKFIAAAEPICRQGNAATHALGEKLSQAVAGSGSLQETVLTGLVQPGIKILSRQAGELRNLPAPRSSEDLQTYLGLYDPIIELSYQLEAALQDAEDPHRSREIELLISELGNLQGAAARRFGMHACSIDFTGALGGAK